MPRVPSKSFSMDIKRLSIALIVGAVLALVGYFIGLHMPLVEPAFVYEPEHSAFLHAAIAGVVGVILGFAVKD